MQSRHLYALAVLALCALSACAAPDDDNDQSDPLSEQTVSHEQLLGDEQSISLQPRVFGFGTSCSPNPCRNGGSCVDQWLGYTCKCAPGFSGAKCEKSVAPSCGDGKVTAGEQCDPRAPGFSIWTCDADCNRITAYTPCSSTAPCNKDQACVNGLNFCSASCATSNQCPATASGSTTHPVCPVELNPTGYGLCVAAGCSTSADCAPGLRCYVGGSFPFCAACTASSTCL